MQLCSCVSIYPFFHQQHDSLPIPTFTKQLKKTSLILSCQSNMTKVEHKNYFFSLSSFYVDFAVMTMLNSKSSSSVSSIPYVSQEYSLYVPLEAEAGDRETLILINSQFFPTYGCQEWFSHTFGL